MDREKEIRKLETNFKKLEKRTANNLSRRCSSVRFLDGHTPKNMPPSKEEKILLNTLLGILSDIHFSEINHDYKAELIDQLGSCYEDARKWLYEYSN